MYDLEVRNASRASMTRLDERLGVPFDLGGIEMRAKPNGTAAGSNFEWNGYASVYDAPFPMWDRLGEPFTESVAPGAAKRSLANPALDVPFKFGHSEYGIPYARTLAGTMKLSEDSHGLHVHVPAMDGRREDVRALASAVERGDVSEMSLAFICNRQAWDDAYEHRTVQEMDLHRGDVSAVVHGANPATAGAWMLPVEQLSFRRPAAIGGPVLLERRSAASLAEQHGHPGRPCLDPDGDCDCDLTPAGDTDHDYWAADGTQLKPLPDQRSESGPYELRASAADSIDIANSPDYNPSYVPCPACRAGNDAKANYCNQCGKPMGQSMAQSATVTVDATTGIPGEESQFSAARRLELCLRELDLEELAYAR